MLLSFLILSFTYALIVAQDSVWFLSMCVQEVAILEFGDFLGGGSGNNHIDHHRDMRLDIEEMSYEVTQSLLFTYVLIRVRHVACLFIYHS